jgi:hypothetical protein
MPDATHYTYRVAWSVEDGEHVATVAEFRHCLGSRPPRSKHSPVSPMSCVTCSPTWLNPANRSQSRCRSAPTQAGSWCGSQQRSTVALSAKLPNST